MNNGPKRDMVRPMMGPGRGRGGPMMSRMHAEKPKNAGKTLLRLLRYIGSSKGILISIIAIMCLITVIDLAIPWVQGEAINSIVYDKLTGTTSVNWNGIGGLYYCLGLLAVLYVCSATLSFFSARLAAKLSLKTVYKLRRELFKKISALPIKYTDTHRHGDIMSRMTNDVENVSHTISQSIASLFSGTITLVGTLVIMISISPIMTVVAFVAIPLTVLVSTVLTKAMRKYYVKQQKLLGALNGHIEEMVTGYNTVVAYGKEKDEREKFAEISEELRHTGIKAKVWGGIMGPCMNLIGNLQYLLVAGFGGFFALSGGVFAIKIGDIQKMLQYSKKFTRPINELANQFTAILTALAGAERIFEIFDGGDEIDRGKSDMRACDMTGNIEFKSVDFSYKEGEPVLRKFDLSVRSGQKIAIVGATGSGKTTVVNLLTRFYEIDGGSIKIDGVDIRDIPKRELREAIGIVLQDTVLFSDSIRQNIMYGNFNADEESMKNAATMARAAEFIDRLPEGYDTQLTEAGRNLSQGQRQLLSIARAILKDPKILILDEATSSVDTRTEMNIQSAMVALMKNRTSLIIAHRLSTIRDADVIVVISNGRVVEAGNHEELLALGGEYHKLYSSQFAGVAI